MNMKKEFKATILDFRVICVRKVLFPLLALTLPAVVQAQLICRTNNGQITIAGYNSVMDTKTFTFHKEALIIPEAVNGLPVVSIADHAFYIHDNLVSITLPKSLKSIGNSAFQSCAYLTNVVIPDGVMEIGFGAFAGSRISKMFIPKSVTNIGMVAFSRCDFLESITVDALNPVYSSLDGALLDKSQTKLLQCPAGKAGSYTVPDSVTVIGGTAFQCYHLTSITLPKNVRIVEPHGFSSCPALTNVTIGSGVTNLAYETWLAFQECPKLLSITIDNLNPYFSSVDGVLFNKSKTLLIKYPGGKSGSYAVSNGVTTIGDHAFSEATDLTSIILPESVTTIQDNAFENCTGLESVKFGNKLKTIGNSAFHSCTNLTSLSLPDSLVSIGDGAFYSCNRLSNVVMGKNVTRISKSAFSSCSPALTTKVDPSNPAYASNQGPPADKHQILLPVSVIAPANGAYINGLCVDVHGTVPVKNLKHVMIENPIAHMRIPADIRGEAFEARNVWLMPGTNLLSVIAEDVDENTGTNVITIIRPSEADVIKKLPVEIQVSPLGGFTPLDVTFKVQVNVPGKFLKIFYDFNGDNSDVLTNSHLNPVTHIYRTTGEFFPVVTVETSVGRFSSLPSLASRLPPMSVLALIAEPPPSVTVQMMPLVVSSLKVANPVDIAWTATSNLYVLSGNTATITEFDSQGKPIRSKNRLGINPSGFAVDSDANIYVVVAGQNQLWKLKPTPDSFALDPSFGVGGIIGEKDGRPGSTDIQFNAPFDVVISPDGQTVVVSDSGNQRLQQFTVTGTLSASSNGEQELRQSIKAPRGLATYDDLLLIADAEENRIVLTFSHATLGFIFRGKSGGKGTALGQFNALTHIAASERGLYVADMGNNRVQVCSPAERRGFISPAALKPRLALSSELQLNHPNAVAPVKDSLEEKLYIADTGNDRVLLVKLPTDNPEAVWSEVIARLKAGDTDGALAHFSLRKIDDDFRDPFLEFSKAELRSMAKAMEKIKPITIQTDFAEYGYEEVIDGNTVTSTIKFQKEFGRWKVLEF
jgi:DNA-binding beta-propeller fold protein YncE